jgi:AcrR family transcriptional regulator
VERLGRPALTSAHQLAEVAQELFVEQGFDETSVEDVAEAAGVSRRTFFRYFPTKADVLWVESPAELEHLRTLFGAAPDDEPWDEVLCRAAPAALSHPAEQRSWALHRAQLILAVPAVQAKAARVHGEWRAITTAFVATRRGTGTDDLIAIAAGHAVLAATLAAHEWWVAHPDEELEGAFGRLLRLLVPRS